MTGLKGGLNVNHPRCPYCHDEIVPGGDNHPCPACLAWHHTDCWETHGACSSCGTQQHVIQAHRSICMVHAPELISDEAKRDLRQLWGYDRCTCVKIDPKSRPAPYGSIRAMGAASAVNTAIAAQIKEFNDLRRGDKGPTKESSCAHKFSPVDNRCCYCHKPMEEVHHYWYQEAVNCANPRCENPTTRIETYCSLCKADFSVGLDRPRRAKDHNPTMDSQSRALHSIADDDERTQRDFSPVWMVLFLVVSAQAVVWWWLWVR